MDAGKGLVGVVNQLVGDHTDSGGKLFRLLSVNGWAGTQRSDEPADHGAWASSQTGPLSVKLLLGRCLTVGATDSTPGHGRPRELSWPCILHRRWSGQGREAVLHIAGASSDRWVPSGGRGEFPRLSVAVEVCLR